LINKICYFVSVIDGVIFVVLKQNIVLV